MMFMRYVLQHSAVPFCELVWPTTRRLSRCRSGEDLAGQKFDKLIFFVQVASYDVATLKVTEVFIKVILLSMFVYGDCMGVCLIYTPVSNGCG
jgi:hypothetical protein